MMVRVNGFPIASLGFKYKVEERLLKLKAERCLEKKGDGHGVMYELLNENKRTNALLEKLLELRGGHSWKMFGKK